MELINSAVSAATTPLDLQAMMLLIFADALRGPTPRLMKALRRQMALLAMNTFGGSLRPHLAGLVDGKENLVHSASSLRIRRQALWEQLVASVPSFLDS